MTRLLWHSNAPWAPTGYGQQTALFAPLLAEHYELAISAFYGLEGASRPWQGIQVLPGMGGKNISQVMLDHATRLFNNEPRNGLVITLLDVWVLDTDTCAKMNVASWVPVDHEPAPQKVVDFFTETGAVPIAMSRFGERMLGRLDPLYVPHGIDTRTYRPYPKEEARRGSFPPGAFVVGMVAANKGRPSRKGFSQALQAFARFAKTHDDAYLYLHTLLNPDLAEGENLGGMINRLEIPLDRIRTASQYHMLYEPYSATDMAQLYSGLDVLLNPSLGEGFGIPIIEAQACGVPVIVTKFSAMEELCGSGWMVDHSRFWTGLGSWQAVPDVDDIVESLEECYARSQADVEHHAGTARAFAEQYDVERVFKQHWLPALRTVEQRFSRQAPVRIPSRMSVAA